jgi:hypothetical protein
MIVFGKESPQSVLFETCDALSVALGSYSQRLVRLALEDSRKGIGSKYEGSDDKSSTDSYGLKEFGFSQSESDLVPPDVLALDTLVEFVSYIASKDGSLIEPNFYADLLRALVTEGTSEMIVRVLDIGKSSNLKVHRVDMSKLRNTEELARRAVQGKRIGQPAVVQDLVVGKTVPKFQNLVDDDEPEIIDMTQKFSKPLDRTNRSRRSSEWIRP